MLLRTLVAVLLAGLAFPAAAAGWAWPVDGRVVTPYRNGDDPYAGGQHRGIDIAAAVGTPVRAAAAAAPSRSPEWPARSGLTVAVRTADGRFDTSYLHLASAAVAKGDRVGEGARLGAVGTSGKRSAAAAAPALRCPRGRQPARLPRSARAAPAGPDAGERGTAGRSCGRTRAGAGGAAARTRSPRGAAAAEGPGGAASAGARRPAVAPRRARATGPRAAGRSGPSSRPSACGPPRPEPRLGPRPIAAPAPAPAGGRAPRRAPGPTPRVPTWAWPWPASGSCSPRRAWAGGAAETGGRRTTARRCAAGRSLRAADNTRAASSIERARALLHHHPHLLRERGAPPRPRLHDGRGRRAGPSHAPARRGRLLPHGHRRARRAGRPGGGARGGHPAELADQQRRALQGGRARG